MPEKSHLDHPVNDVNKMVSNSNNFFIYTKIGVRTQNDNHLTVINKKTPPFEGRGHGNRIKFT